jgi:hypothetical protein
MVSPTEDVVINMRKLQRPSTSGPSRELVPGYPALAGRMAVLPQTAIFSRFAALNNRNLLYMQAELTYLEQELIYVESNDSKSEQDKRCDFAGNWQDLSQSVQSDNVETSRQWKLVLLIRQRLKEYSMHSIGQLYAPKSMDPDQEIQTMLSCCRQHWPAWRSQANTILTTSSASWKQGGWGQERSQGKIITFGAQ